MLKAGLSELCITPLLGSMMPGQFNVRFGSRILDDLYTKALVFENNGERAAVVSVDTLFLGDDVFACFREKLTEQTGIKDVIFAATHTHSGGPIDGWGDHLIKDETYADLVVNKSIDAVKTALDKLQPVTIAAGMEKEHDIAFHRRFLMKDGSIRTNPGMKNPDIVKPAGPIDPDVTALRINDLNGNVIGVLSSFSCHLDVLGGDEISADYPGELSNVIKNVYGKDTVSIFLTAPCGNINHTDVSGKFTTKKGHYKRLGKVLAGKVIAAAEKAPVMENNSIAVKYETIECACRQPTKEEANAGRALIEKEKRTHAELCSARDGSLQNLFYAKEAVRMYDNPEPTAKMEIMALKIGDMVIITMPAELFVEFALDIKTADDFPYIMVSSLTNGLVGYVLTKEALEAGSYESLLASSSKMAAEAGYEMVNAAKKLMKNLK